MEYNIAKLSGDGIGPEIIEQAVKVMESVGEVYGIKFDFHSAKVGASAIDICNDPYPEETHQICMQSDAVLFGAIGDPKYDNNPRAKVRPEQGLLNMRKKLELYANIRPVKTFHGLLHVSPLKDEVARGTDIVIIRELTGGIYFGEPRGRSEDGCRSYDTCIYSIHEIQRILKLAYEYAGKRSKLLTVVDKANVLATSRLWRETAAQIALEHKTIRTEYMFVDNAAMQLIQWPHKFDVIVTENMFGDILTDEASVIPGSLGLLPSASIGTYTPVFEPIHGSYPQAKGKNIANPIGSILSVAMLLESLSLYEAASSVELAVEKAIEQEYLTPDLNKKNPRTTTEVGDRIAELVRKSKPMTHGIQQ